MKVIVTMKNPDAVGDGIKDAVTASRPAGITNEEWEAMFDIRREAAQSKLAKWVEYGEYITIEFDTDANTARVVELK